MNYHHRYKRFLILLLSTIILQCSSLGISFAQPMEKRVLVLIPYSIDYPAPMTLIAGLKEKLANNTRFTPKYYYEFVDLQSFPNDESYLSNMAAFLSKKYTRDKLPDYIVTMDIMRPFLLKYGPEVFPNIPTFFVINQASPLKDNAKSNLIAVTQLNTLAIDKNVDLIRSLLPAVKNIYIILGDSAYEKSILPLVKGEATLYKGDVNFKFVNTLTHEKLLDLVGHLGQDSAIYYIQFNNDVTGQAFVPANVVNEICSQSTVPVFVTGSQLLGHGAVGGFVYDYKLIGSYLGSLILTYDEHGSVDKSSLQFSSDHYIFDWRQLDKWGISVAKLPIGSEVLYEEDNFWEIYKTRIILLLLFMVVESLLFIILLKNNQKRKIAEASLQSINRDLEQEVLLRTKDLEIAISKLQSLNGELLIKNDFMEHLATTDRLTNINNRVKLDSILADELEKLKRHGQAFSVILADIDHFKHFNDTYGHQTGDVILKECASFLLQNIRRIDVLGRWGGEEFLIICPNTPKAGAIALAESLRRKIEENKFEGKYTVTISLGVAESLPEDSEMSLFKRADTSLYSAKNNGRNRVGE